MCRSFTFALLVFVFSFSVLHSQQPAVTPSALPQSSTPTYTIHRNVSLVVLDGVAQDSQGKVVTNLKQSDFHITEDKVPQAIRNFEMPGKFTPPQGITINSTADLDHLAPRSPVNIVLLDEFSTRFEDMAFGRYSLKKWLDKQPQKLNAPTMLVAVDLQKFTVLRDYTQNKEEILKALDHHFATYPWQTHNGGWIAERYATAFNTLSRVAEATSGHAGHKNMIWIGRGFPTINLADYPPEAQEEIDKAIQSAITELRDARVTLYTIDPAGVMIDPGVYGQDAADYDPFGGDADFEGLARATGGRSLHGRNDVDVQIGTAIQDNANLYTLTYSPTDQSDDDPSKFRHIKVTIDRPGITFLTRQGYFPSVTPERLDDSGKADGRLIGELVNAAASNMSYDAVNIAVQVSTEDTSKVSFFVPSRSLSFSPAEQSKPSYARLIVLGSIFDKKGKALNTYARTYTLHAPENTSADQKLIINVRSDFQLPKDPKAVRARLVIRVENSGHMGTVDFALTPGANATNSSFDPQFPSNP